MKSSALVLIAVALAAGSADAAPQRYSAKKGPRAIAPACTLTTPICGLQGYDPRPPASGGTYNAPAICTTNDSRADVVKRAFATAPANLQKEICNLDAIFIVDGDFSWGFWENPTTRPSPNGGAPRLFVGIQRDVLTQDLATYKQKVLDKVLQGHVPSGVKYNVPNSTADQTIVAVLAHEVGHIKWHRENIYSTLRCYYPTFVDGSPGPGGPPGPAWQKNTLPASVSRLFHPEPGSNDAPGGAAPGRGIKPPHAGNLNPADVRAYFAGGFASAFAAISPEEDFVETYTLRALMNSNPPPTVSIGFGMGGGAPVGIPPKLGEPGHDPLKAKFDCIDSLPGPSLARRR
jgi:hypothetical protein